MQRSNFSYDAMGNRTASQNEGGTSSYTRNSLNQYTALSTTLSANSM